MSMSNLGKSTGSKTSSPSPVLSIHPSSSQSIAIILTTNPLTADTVETTTSAPFKQTASFSGFIDRNSECTDLVGLVIACIIFLVAQTVLITIWYYLYVKIKWQRRSLMAIETQRQKNLQNAGTHFPPNHLYGACNQNPIPIKPIHHQFPHHLLHPATHQYQLHNHQRLLVQQQQQHPPIDVRTEFEADRVYESPGTIYNGTVIRHRVGSRLSNKHAYASHLSAFGTKRRSVLKRTLRGNVRKSGGFLYYPNAFSSPSKLVTSDSQDESCKSRVYEVFTTSSGLEDEDITCGQVNSGVIRHEDQEREEREVGQSERYNSLTRNLFHHL